MFLRSFLVAIAAVTVVIEAQTATRPTGASSTSSTAVTTHTIAVGANGFKFEPDNVTAAVGDWIEWNFYPGGHGVAQSDFGRACIPWELQGTNRKAGFYSGIKNTNVYTADGPKYRVLINDTTPIFYFCTAPSSCFKEHMIGAINPNATWSLEKQQEAAAKAGFQVTPGETLPSETGEPTPTPTQTGGSSQNSQPNNNSSSSSDSHSLSAGAIAGIAIGAAAVLILAGALIWLCGRHSKSDRGNRESMNRNSFPTGAMLDAKYTSPSSPGQSTFTGNPHYSLPPGNDPYRPGTQSPPLHQQHFSGQAPISPGSHLSHHSYQNLNQHASMLSDGSHPYYDNSHHHTPPPQAPPVELPTSGDPGNSPIPPYSAGRQMSWSAGQESGYRPGPK